ncbi:MAG: gamma carbonic anhydrase family protein [Thaumarchaeota archaeon]|nr:gamma carbonic anhydrase family protein [Nitrososphaerota archaeon]
MSCKTFFPPHKMARLETILSILSYKGKTPKFPKSCFVAETATLAGDITLGEDCSVWYGAVLRAEVAPLRIGRRSNMQDNTIMHTDLDFPVDVGNEVTIGHAAIIHGATILSHCLIGMRSTLLNGSKIGENCIVAAGSLVTQGTEIPDNSLVMGSPAVAKRTLTKEEIERIGVNSEHYDSFRAEYLGIQSRE